jgi:hypothetical protein
MRSNMLLCGRAQMRLAGGPRPDRGGSGLRARPKPKEGFSFFEFIFNAKQFQKNLKIV